MIKVDNNKTYKLDVLNNFDTHTKYALLHGTRTRYEYCCDDCPEKAVGTYQFATIFDTFDAIDEFLIGNVDDTFLKMQIEDEIGSLPYENGSFGAKYTREAYDATIKGCFAVQNKGESGLEHFCKWYDLSDYLNAMIVPCDETFWENVRKGDYVLNDCYNRVRTYANVKNFVGDGFAAAVIRGRYVNYKLFNTRAEAVAFFKNDVNKKFMDSWDFDSDAFDGTPVDSAFVRIAVLNPYDTFSTDTNFVNVDDFANATKKDDFLEQLMFTHAV